MHVTASLHIRCRRETLLAHDIQNKDVSFQLQGHEPLPTALQAHSLTGRSMDVLGPRLHGEES
jgi:hypothetical protein